MSRCPKYSTTLKINPKAQPAEVIEETALFQNAAASPTAQPAANFCFLASAPSASAPPAPAPPAPAPSAASSQRDAVETNQAPPVNMQAKHTAVSALLGITVRGLMLLAAEFFLAARSPGSYSCETTPGTITRSALTSSIQVFAAPEAERVPYN